ncbi:MAG TPA: TonB-dependent receptor, partial [Rhodothermales bacterium]|nr:TonB-dependent receptor [Rhodothermales bacterium]
MRFLCALAGLLLLPALAFGQVLTGRVADAGGEPLTGATVTLHDATGLVASTVTNATGRYRLDARRAGAFRLRVAFVGYRPFETDVTLAAGPTTRDVVMDEAAVEASEVVVEGFARGVATVSPVTASTLTAAELETLPDAKDFPVQLATQPSVTFYSENGNGLGYNYLRLRGFDERRVAVSINGLPQNDPEDHAVYWINFTDLQGAVTDIQVQRGAGTAFYGSTAIGGAVNVVADPYRMDRYATVEAGYGTYATQRLTAEVNTGLLGGRYVAFLRATRLASDGYREHSWVRLHRVFGGVTRFGRTTRLTLQAWGGPQHDALAYYGIPKGANDAPVDDGAGGTINRRSNYGAISGDVERFNQPQVEFRHEWQVRPGVRVEGTAYFTSGNGYFDFDGTWRSADYLRLPIGYGGLSAEDRQRPLYETFPGQALTFRAYVDNDRWGYLPRVVVERGRNRYTVGADALVHRSLHWSRIQATSLAGVTAGADAAHVVEYRGGKEALAVYGSALLRPVEAIAVQGDLSVRRLRYRLYDEAFFGNEFAVPYTFVNPRVGVTVFPEQPVRAYASVAYAEREPRLKNFYDADEAGTGARPLFATRANGSLDFSRPLVRPE